MGSISLYFDYLLIWGAIAHNKEFYPYQQTTGHNVLSSTLAATIPAFVHFVK